MIFASNSWEQSISKVFNVNSYLTNKITVIWSIWFRIKKIKSQFVGEKIYLPSHGDLSLFLYYFEKKNTNNLAISP